MTGSNCCRLVNAGNNQSRNAFQSIKCVISYASLQLVHNKFYYKNCFAANTISLLYLQKVQSSDIIKIPILHGKGWKFIMNTAKQKISWIELCRFIAAICIIWLHMGVTPIPRLGGGGYSNNTRRGSFRGIFFYALRLFCCGTR